MTWIFIQNNHATYKEDIFYKKKCINKKNYYENIFFLLESFVLLWIFTLNTIKFKYKKKFYNNIARQTDNLAS